MRFLRAVYYLPFGWLVWWLIAVGLQLLGHRLTGLVFLALSIVAGWRVAIGAAIGGIHGRYRAHQKAKATRTDARTSTRTRASTSTTAQGAPARVTDFDGFELAIGTIYGMRSWRVMHGLLRPIHHSDEPWHAGENVARCIYNTHPVPNELCMCGYYAYTEPQTAPSTYVRGVIAGYGRTLIGSKGFRCEKARIVAFLDPRGMSLYGGRRTYKALRDSYPDVPIYHSQRAMLRAFPLGDE